jgi:hypothetical protein
MSDLTEEGGGLSKLSAAELAQAYVESVQAAEATEHIGGAVLNGGQVS